ncbi:MAG: glycerol-3-phosphate 1-O-acyltransferase PlsY [Sedimentisphaerales bacterium]|nr:glycerol-3-phosphate 1-O-acyltransferase PlsY [Sedimentisphaerales bacterium]
MDRNTIITVFLILPLLGYFLGAIPFGYLIGQVKGVNIREHGSGNIGSTNVGRVLGRKWGFVCFICDVAKGFVPVWWTGRYLHSVFEGASDGIIPTEAQIAWLIVAAGCILGHMFSIYLRFRGGKGVATSLGAIMGIWPYFTLTGLVVLALWVAAWGVWRYVSLASIITAVAFPVAFAVIIWRVDRPEWRFINLIPLFVFSCLMAGLVILRHRANISRLLTGTENRGGKTNDSQEKG